MEMEGEMKEDSIPRPLWKEIREMGRRRNGQVLQVMEEEGEISLFLPPQYKSHNKGGQENNQTTIQTSQPGSEPTQMGVTENTLQEDLPSTTPSAQ